MLGATGVGKSAQSGNGKSTAAAANSDLRLAADILLEPVFVFDVPMTNVLFCNADKNGAYPRIPLRCSAACPCGTFSIDSPQIETQHHQNNTCPQGAPGQIEDRGLTVLPGPKSA